MDEEEAELHEEEKILASYGEEIPTEEEDDDVTKCFNLTGSNLEFELIRAFELMANGEDSIPKEKVKQVFLAVGLTFQSWDLEKLLSNSITDAYGNYSCDVICEAFEFWIQNQLSLEDIYQAFKMIQTHRKIITANPFEVSNSDVSKVSISQFSEKLFKDIKTSKEVFKSILSEVLCVDGGNYLTDDEVNNVILEISSDAFENITFEDFLRLFRS